MQLTNQFGLSTIAVISSLVIFGLISSSFLHRLEVEGERTIEEATTNSIIQIAHGQLNHYADATESHYLSFASNVDQLKARGYLPSFFRNVNSYGSPFSMSIDANGNLVVTTVVEGVAQARRIALRFGSSAEFSGNTVKVGFPPPIAIAVADEVYVRRDGARDIFGTLYLRAGVSGIELNGNSIVGGSSVESDRFAARNLAGTGLVDANSFAGDVAVLQTLRVRDFEYTP